METIIATLITGACSIIAVVITNLSNNRKTEAQIEKNQAITDTKLEELTREVRIHNNFAQRVPILEEKVKNLEKRGDEK